MLLMVLHSPVLPMGTGGERRLFRREVRAWWETKPPHPCPRSLRRSVVGVLAADDGPERFDSDAGGHSGPFRFGEGGSCPGGNSVTNELSYAVLRRAVSPSEHEHARVLMIVDSVDEAEVFASELLRRGVSAEIRAAVGAGPTLRLRHR